MRPSEKLIGEISKKSMNGRESQMRTEPMANHTLSRNSLRSADFHCSVFWGTPLFVLKHDDRRGEIAPLDACQVTLMRIDLHEDLYKAKNINVFHERNGK